MDYVINLTVVFLSLCSDHELKTLRNFSCLEYWSFMSSSNADRIVNLYTFRRVIVIPHPNNKRNYFLWKMVKFAGSINIIICRWMNTTSLLSISFMRDKNVLDILFEFLTLKGNIEHNKATYLVYIRII